MNATKAAAAYSRLRDQSLWRLLAADNGPSTLAVLQCQFMGEQRSLPASVLFERIERDLEALRGLGHDLPRTAQVYVAGWLGAGYLRRRFPAGAAEEEYELTADAAGAIRFIESLIETRKAATESRLATVIQQLVRLAEETESNPEARIAALTAERERIDAEIARIREGRLQTLPDERAIERIRDTITLAGDLAADFRNVRDDFDHLNRQLRERIMDEVESRGEVLEALFEGVDVIAESEAGRTFHAFWRLLTDPEQSGTFEEALDKVLSREFSGQLDARERTFLLRLIPTLLAQGGLVHEVLQHFARTLKQFVQSREYLEQSRMTQLIREAQRTALEVKDSIATTDRLGYDLQLTSSRIRSVDQWVLYDPTLNTIEKGVAAGDAPVIDPLMLGDLVAHSEIDFRSLKENVRAALERQASVTIGQIMDEFPAVQGLGSVVGYLALGSRHGIATPEHVESVGWQAEDGPWRQVRIPKIYFLREHAHELA